MFFSCFTQRLENQIEIRAVRDNNINHQPDFGIPVRPVGDPVGNEFGVGDNNGNVVEGLDGCRAKIDRHDGYRCLVEIE